MKIFKTILLFICVVVSAKAQVANDYMDNYMQEYSQQNYFSGNVLVAYNDEIIFQESYGKASHTFDVDNSVDTKFNIASLSKQFTAFLILKLSELGKLNLDDPITRFLENFPDDKFGRITIHHLLSNTSGIPSYGEIASRLNDYFSQEAYLELIKEKELVFEPGEKFLYSSLGYYLLAVIAEKSTRETYHQLLKTYVFSPADMRFSYDLDGESILTNYATGYVNVPFSDELKIESYRNYTNALGAGSIVSTTNDLYNWSKIILKEKLINRLLWKKMFTPRVAISETEQYGYGWMILQKNYSEFDSLKIIEHSGTHSGYRSKFRVIPSLKLTIIVLTNFGNVPIDNIVEDLTEIAISEKPIEAPIPTPISLNEAQIKKWQGIYKVDDFEFRLNTNSKTVSLDIFKNGQHAKGPIEYLYSSAEIAFNRTKPQLTLKLSNEKLELIDFDITKMVAVKQLIIE